MNKLIIALIITTLFTSCGVTRKYEDAKASQSISAYEEYVSRFPKSKYLPQAQKELHQLYEERDWTAALTANTVSAYDRFISDYPYSKHSADAERNLTKAKEREAWNMANGTNTIYAFENFKTNFPWSDRISTADYKIQLIKDEIAWKESELIGTAASYREYISSFPNGSQKSKALDRIKEIEIIKPAWEKTQFTNTPDAWEKFINQYGSSIYGDRARAILRGLDDEYWNEASNENLIPLYQDYLLYFPKGKHATEAKKAIIDKEVDIIFMNDHGKLPPMSKTSSESSYSTSNEIEIYNNTNYTLTVRYSSALESKKITFLPKQKKEFKLSNGKYRVSASVDAANVNNYAGKEELEGGRYTTEYYIVTTQY